jgi:hypothetical protein
VTWFRLDDNATFHRKTLAAGNEAYGAFCRLGTHSSAQLTDGFVDQAAAMLIAGSQDVLDRLVTVGFLDLAEGGYQLHDFGQYNPSAAAEREKRDRVSQARKEAGRRGGQRSGEARQGGNVFHLRSKPEANPKQTEASAPASPSTGEATDSQAGEANPKQTGSKPEANGKQTHEEPRSKTEPPSRPVPEEPPIPPAPGGGGSVPGESRGAEGNDPPAEASDPLGPQIREVFEHWRRVMEKNDRAVLAGKRAKAVQARLREGYTVEQLCRAVDGCKRSPHHQGKNDSGVVYDDLELICRSAVKVDAFLALAGGKAEARPAQRTTTESSPYTVYPYAYADGTRPK